MVLSKKRITKALIRLRWCAGWSAPVLFANPRRQVFSRRGPYMVKRWGSERFPRYSPSVLLNVYPHKKHEYNGYNGRGSERFPKYYECGGYARAAVLGMLYVPALESEILNFETLLHNLSSISTIPPNFRTIRQVVILRTCPDKIWAERRRIKIRDGQQRLKYLENQPNKVKGVRALRGYFAKNWNLFFTNLILLVY